MSWLAGQGAIVSLPFGHCPAYDVIADFGDRLLRVEVKTSTCRSQAPGRWAVTVCTRGGNQSWSGLVKEIDPARTDFLFAHAGDGRRWFIPTTALEGRSTIALGGPKYSEFEVERGDPLPVREGASAALDSPGD